MSGKIKLLYVLPDLSNAGPVNMCLNLIRGLELDSYDIEIVSLGGGILVDEFKQYGKVNIFSRKNILGFCRFVRNKQFDIIHSHTIIADIFSSFSNSKAKKITTIHNYPNIDSIYRRGKVIGGGLYLLQMLAIKNMLKVACSDAVKVYCSSVLKFKYVESIPNGVLPYEGLNKNESDGVVNFYYLGSISRRKNVEEIISAFTRWVVNKNAILNIVGGGELLESLSEKYKSDKIHFRGKIHNPEVVVNDFDCFVSASKAEGMPLALLEALSLGKSYICSNIEPHCEVHKYDEGNSGFIYESGNIEKLINAYDSYYLSEKKVEMAISAKKCFENYYDAKIMSSRYCSLYKLLCDKLKY